MFPRVFSENNVIQMLRNFRGYGAAVHDKTIVCSVYSKNLHYITRRNSCKIVLQREPFPDVYKKGLFENFLKLARKHL